MMRSKEPIIPAILTTDRATFARRLRFAKSVGNSVHVDVVDPQYAKGKSLAISSWPPLNIGYAEAHLMVRKPLDYLQTVKDKGVHRAIIHLESQFNLEELTMAARQIDLLLGFAVDLDTDLGHLKQVYSVSNYIQVMGVVPGRAGQAQHSQTNLAVTYLAKVPNQRLIITVDGGVSAQNIPRLRSAGAQYFIASSTIFNRGDWPTNFQRLLATLGMAPISASELNKVS